MLQNQKRIDGIVFCLPDIHLSEGIRLDGIDYINGM